MTFKIDEMIRQTRFPLPVAVRAGAQLVRDVDAALAWDGGDNPEVDALEVGGGRLHAVAGSLAVWCGAGRIVEPLDPVAAWSRHVTRPGPRVRDAGGQAACNLPAGNGRIDRSRDQSHADHHNANQLANDHY